MLYYLASDGSQKEPFTSTVQNNKSSSRFQHETSVCYSDFCDIFRCDFYLRQLQRKLTMTTKNHRGAFTRTWGSRQAFYDLGINLHSDLEDGLVTASEAGGGLENKALMTMPPSKVLKALDDNNSDKFIVGVEASQNVQDPLAFDVALEKSETSSRPRGGGDRHGNSSKKSGKTVGKKDSFQEELEDIFSRTLNALEKKLGRQLFNDTISELEENNDHEEEEVCNPQELQLVQAKCQKLIHDCISPLLIDLADSEFVEMEGTVLTYNK